MISKYMSRNTTRGGKKQDKTGFLGKKNKTKAQQVPSSCGVNGHTLTQQWKTSLIYMMWASGSFPRVRTCCPRARSSPDVIPHGQMISLHHHCMAPTCAIPPSGRNNSDLSFKWNYSHQNEPVHEMFRPPVRAQGIRTVWSMPALEH